MEKKEYAVSVIIPVYNTEKYLEKCLESILSQSFEDIEIIMVNDGSTDGSMQICEKYAQENARVKLIYQPNQGLSGARNRGIDEAKGEYIAFVDSDDFVSSRMLEILYKDCVSNSADISVCGYVRTKFDYEFRESNIKSSSTEIISGEEAFGRLLTSRKRNGGVTVWGKLFNKKLFKNTRFPEKRVFEDAATTYKLYFDSDNISLRDDKLYCYVKRNGSIVNEKFSPQSMQRLKAAEEVTEFVLENCPEFYEHARCFTVISALRLMADILCSGRKCNSEECLEVKRLIDKNKDCRLLSHRHKAMIKLLDICPSIFIKLYFARS